MDVFLQISDGIKVSVGLAIKKHRRFFCPNWESLQDEIFKIIDLHLTADEDEIYCDVCGELITTGAKDSGVEDND